GDKQHRCRIKRHPFFHGFRENIEGRKHKQWSNRHASRIPCTRSIAPTTLMLILYTICTACYGLWCRQLFLIYTVPTSYLTLAQQLWRVSRLKSSGSVNCSLVRNTRSCRSCRLGGFSLQVQAHQGNS